MRTIPVSRKPRTGLAGDSPIQLRRRRGDCGKPYINISLRIQICTCIYKYKYTGLKTRRADVSMSWPLVRVLSDSTAVLTPVEGRPPVPTEIPEGNARRSNLSESVAGKRRTEKTTTTRARERRERREQEPPLPCRRSSRSLAPFTPPRLRRQLTHPHRCRCFVGGLPDACLAWDHSLGYR